MARMKRREVTEYGLVLTTDELDVLEYVINNFDLTNYDNDLDMEVDRVDDILDDITVAIADCGEVPSED